MKHLSCLAALACLLLVPVPTGAQDIARTSSVKIDSKALGQQRELLIYTPAGYDSLPKSYFDVIYVFDAQNREFFDLTSALLSFVGDKQCIVVGITSPYIEELNYARNNDMLPAPIHSDPKTFFNGYAGNADNFIRYVGEEVIPYVERHYRTRNHRLAVGHSLGASLILYAWLQQGLFDQMIAVSPNMAYDKERLTDDLEQKGAMRMARPGFLFLSRSDEGATYWPEWGPAFDRTFAILDSLGKGASFSVVTARYPEQGHWFGFAAAAPEALRAYLKYREEHGQDALCGERREIVIRLTTPSSVESVYVSGNQPSLGDWEPNGAAMQKVSDTLWELRTTVQTPCEIQFTRGGTWDARAFVEGDSGQEGLYLDLSKERLFCFTLESWTDGQ